MRTTQPDPACPALTEAQAAQPRALEGRWIETGAIPEAPAAHWRTAERGRFFRPARK